jgi:hypothetical protein
VLYASYYLHRLVSSQIDRGSDLKTPTPCLAELPEPGTHKSQQSFAIVGVAHLNLEGGKMLDELRNLRGKNPC